MTGVRLKKSVDEIIAYVDETGEPPVSYTLMRWGFDEADLARWLALKPTTAAQRRLLAEASRLRHYQEYYWARILANGKYVTGAIFALKQFGWIDRSTEDKGAVVNVSGEGIGGRSSAV